MNFNENSGCGRAASASAKGFRILNPWKPMVQKDPSGGPKLPCVEPLVRFHCWEQGCAKTNSSQENLEQKSAWTSLFEMMPKSEFSITWGVAAHCLTLCLCGPGHTSMDFQLQLFFENFFWAFLGGHSGTIFPLS